MQRQLTRKIHWNSHLACHCQRSTYCHRMKLLQHVTRYSICSVLSYVSCKRDTGRISCWAPCAACAAAAAAADRRPHSNRSISPALLYCLHSLIQFRFVLCFHFCFGRSLGLLISRTASGRRLSWPGWLFTYRDAVPVQRRSPVPILTGSDVE